MADRLSPAADVRPATVARRAADARHAVDSHSEADIRPATPGRQAALRRTAGAFLGAAVVASGLLVSAAPATAVSASASTIMQPATTFGITSFRTPSGNIRCAAIKSGRKWSLRCDITERSWPPPPGECPDFGDLGNSVAMTKRARSRFICVSDAVPGRKVLGYGQTWDRGPFTCTSRRKGLRCYNTGGYGWFLSRERYRLF
jgi:hypothetical protein